MSSPSTGSPTSAAHNGNWKSHGLKSWEEVLHDYAIQPVQQFAYTKGKNATDAAMIIDAMDLLYTQRLDAFCLIPPRTRFHPAGDAHFAPTDSRYMVSARRKLPSPLSMRAPSFST